MAETISGLYKSEVIAHESPWSGKNDVAFATLEWVDGCNTKRPFAPIRYTSPAQAEKGSYENINKVNIAEEQELNTLPVNSAWFICVGIASVKRGSKRFESKPDPKPYER